MLRQVPTESQMSALALELVSSFRFPEIVYLCGELGAGKTTLSREILRGLGHAGAVKSPTYTLYESYQLFAPKSGRSLTAHHFDLYRLADPDELEYIGIRDLLEADLILIEWPDRGGEHIPQPTLTIEIRYTTTSSLPSEQDSAIDSNANLGREVIITRHD